MLQNSRFFTYGINSSEGAFQSYVFHLSIERAAMKTQCFVNIWKAFLAPFAPSSNCAPGPLASL